MNVTITYLRAFLAVVKQGSFSKAAEELNITQPTLSVTIRQLEQALKIRLLDRTTRRISLTEEGAEFYPTVERLLHDFDAALNDVRSIAERRTGKVSLAMLPSIATELIPIVVARYSELYPGVKIHLRDDNTSGVWRRVARQEVDFGIAGAFEGDSDLEFLPIISDRFGVVALEDHPLAREEGPLAWSELAAYKIIGLASDTGIKPLLVGRRGIPDNVRAPNHEVSNIMTVMNLVDAGFGIAAIPSFAAMRRQHARVIFRELVRPTIKRDIGLVKRRGKALSPAAQSMQKLILDMLPEIKTRPDLNID